jgi:hypothetical protein
VRTQQINSRKVSLLNLRLVVVSLKGLGEYSEPLSAMLSSCARTAFRSLTCAPLGILLFLPVAEILTCELVLLARMVHPYLLIIKS